MVFFHKFVKELLDHFNVLRFGCLFDDEDFNEGIAYLESDVDCITLSDRVVDKWRQTLHVYVEHAVPKLEMFPMEEPLSNQHAITVIQMYMKEMVDLNLNEEGIRGEIGVDEDIDIESDGGAENEHISNNCNTNEEMVELYLL